MIAWEVLDPALWARPGLDPSFDTSQNVPNLDGPSSEKSYMCGNACEQLAMPYRFSAQIVVLLNQFSSGNNSQEVVSVMRVLESAGYPLEPSHLHRLKFKMGAGIFF